MAKLIWEGKNRSYNLEEQIFTIGRSSKCEIVIDDSCLSRKHCEVGKSEEGYYIKDLGSYNGTIVNKKNISCKILEDKDKIRLGNNVFIFAKKESSIQAFSPKLIIKPKNGPKKILVLSEETYTIGRTNKSDIFIDNSLVSSKHAEIQKKDDKWYLKDLNSRNGTFVNSKKIKSCNLKNQDKILIGNTVCLFLEGKKSSQKVAKSAYCFGIILAAIFTLFLGLLFFLKNTKLSTIKLKKGNLLDDYSFEEGRGWHCIGNMKIVNDSSKTGKSCLFYSSSKKSHFFNKANYWSTVPLNYSKLYYLSAWVKYKELEGIAGIEVTWLNEDRKKITRDYTPLITGSNTDWQKIESFFIPPNNSKYLHLSCFVIGKANLVCFDDIFINDKNKNEYTPPSISQDRLKVCVDNRGILCLKKSDKIILDNMKLLLFDDNELFFNQSFSIGEIKSSEKEILWDGIAYDLNNYNSLPLKISCKKEKEDINILVSFKVPDNLKKPNLEYRCKLFDKNFNRNIKLKNLNEEMFSETIDKNFERSATSIFFELKDILKNQFGFYFKDNLFCKFYKDEEGFNLSFKSQCYENSVNFMVKIKINWSRREKLKEWLNLAFKYDNKEKKLGEAFKYYKKIRDNFAFYEAGEKSIKRLKELNIQFNKDLKHIEQEYINAKFFENLHLYKNCYENCKSKILIWEDYPGIEHIKKILKELETTIKQFNKKIVKHDTQIILEEAKNLSKESNMELAVLFYKEIIKKISRI